MKATFDAFLTPVPDSLARFIERTELFSVLMGDQAVSWKERQANQVSADNWEIGFGSDAGLDVTCHMQIDREYGALEYRLTLTNSSTKTSKPISHLWALSLTMFGFEGVPKIVSSSGGPYEQPVAYPGREVWWVRTDMPVWGCGPEFSHGPDDGVSSAQDLPIFIATAGPKPDAPGLFLGLDWSGLWHGNFKVINRGRDEQRSDTKRPYAHFAPGLSVKLGPSVNGLVLDPGEILKLPSVHIGFFEGGVDAGSNALRRYIADRLIPPIRGVELPPATYSNWPGNREPFVEDDLYREMDISADLGIETANVDVWWCKGSGAGNWPEDPQKWPRGIEAFGEHVHSLGIGWGLYIDIEVISEGTTIWNDYPHLLFPDALRGPSDRKFMRGRYRLLNFALAETCDTVFELVSELLTRLKQRYIHWECTQGPLKTLEAVDPTGKIQFAYYEGLYSVWERLLEQHPDLFIQNNFVGAHRLDLGIMKRSHGCWATEVMADPHRCRRMQLSANTFFPGSHIGTVMAHKPLKYHIGMDEQISDLSCISRMAGLWFISGRLQELDQAQLANLKHWVGVYKRFRHLLMKDYYHLTPQPQSEAEWDAGQFCDGSKQGIVLVFRYEGTTDHQDIPIKSVDPQSTYRVTNEKTGDTAKISGKELLSRGLSIELKPNDARFFSYKVI